MPRLIDADEIKKREKDVVLANGAKHRCFDTTMLYELPTVEAEPVRHGHWVKDDTGAEYCSNCHEYPYDDGEYHIANWHSDYCPHCGAKMDGGRREDET